MALNTNLIQSLIIDSAKTITNIPKIVLPNTSHKPSLGTPYIVTRFTMGEPTTSTIGAERIQRVTGTFVFDHWFKVNSGFNSVADDIIAHFTKPENIWLDYSNNFKIQIHTAYRGNDFVNQDNSWARNTAILRYYLSYESN